jgi:hypothetical protein
MFSSVAIEHSDSFQGAERAENGMIQVSAANGLIGIAAQRDGRMHGLLLTPSQAAALAARLTSASNACGARPTKGAARKS